MLPDLTDPISGARNLLGWEIIHHTENGDIGGIIIETEAYSQDDEASHSFRGETPRNSPMFDEAGTIYMYFTYGMHWCFNIATSSKGVGEAVLIRALKPTIGIELMKRNRSTNELGRLTNGPANFTQALEIPSDYTGKHISKTELELKKPDIKMSEIKASSRIGISKAKDNQWRFSINL